MAAWWNGLTDAMQGVIIGGSIAAFSGIITALIGFAVNFWLESIRWKREKKIEYLTARKTELNTSFTKIINQFQNLFLGHAPSESTVALFLNMQTMPLNVQKCIYKLLDLSAMSDIERNEKLAELSAAMTNSMKELEEEIKKAHSFDIKPTLKDDKSILERLGLRKTARPQ